MDDQLADRLKAEYQILQSHYEGFDSRALTIKAWGTALISGGLAIGFQNRSFAVLLAIIVASACLWALETIWKSHQFCYSERIMEIEAWFRGESVEKIEPFQIYSSWSRSYQSNYKTPTKLARISLWPMVNLPYLPIIILCLAGMLWLELGR